MTMIRLSLIGALLLMMSACTPVLTAVNDEGIQEDPGRRTLGTAIDDQSLETTIAVNLNTESEALKNSHINVHSYNGIVLLVGQVPSQELKNLATEVATRSSPNRVKQVYNELEVAGTTTFLSRSNDAWITAKIKTMMLADSEISSGRTKVVTENGAVYLMGIVTRAQADKVVELVSNTRGVTKVVRAFEYIN